MSRPRHARQTAFTLLELLVVIGVIGILAALLLPALNLAREKGRSAACVANLKQLYLALSMYADDNSERYPFAAATLSWDEVSPQGTVGWMRAIQPYLKSTRVLKCPSDKDSEFSYFMSTRAAYVTMTNKFASVNRAAIDRPEAFVLAGDTFSDPAQIFKAWDCDKDDYTQNCVGGPAVVGQPYVEWRRHGGAQNILFADGHVSAHTTYQPEQMTFRYSGIQPW